MGDKIHGPEHLVRITQPFYLGRYPVSQAQWSAVMNTNPAHFKGDDQRLVDRVSWEDIVEENGFLERLSKWSDRAFRLPTEAEWEYAAKGGHLAPPPTEQLAAANLYPPYAGGEDINAVAWQRENDSFTTLRGGYRQPNVLGLYSMSGNVREWCQDTWDRQAYQKRKVQGEVTVDPLEECPDTPHRVLRGGSWLLNPVYCRSANRFGRRPASRSFDVGFRLVLSPSSV